jgi:hypothetical protein
MRCIRTMLVSTMMFILIAGCGPSANTPAPVPPPIAARPDVIVTVDGKRHACIVALYSEAHGSTISCDDVIPFVREELRVPSGSIYDIRAVADVDQAELARVGARLNGAGYRFIGGPPQRSPPP